MARLLDWLQSRGDGYAEALRDLSVVRVAVNQHYVEGLAHPVQERQDRGLPARNRPEARAMNLVQREDFDVGVELERLAAGNPRIGWPAFHRIGPRYGRR